MKDFIVQYIQRTYDFGHDIAVSLRNLEKINLNAKEYTPERKISEKTEEQGKEAHQEGLDMMYKAEIEQHMNRKLTLEQNIS